VVRECLVVGSTAGDGYRGGATRAVGRRYAGIPCSTWTSIVFTSSIPTLVSIRSRGDAPPSSECGARSHSRAGVSSVEGPLGEDDDLGQTHEAVRRVGRERADRAPTAEGAGGHAEDRGEPRV
jgi:hypothetical protein